MHWPFCERKCPYCDFNSHVAPNAPDHAAWRDALLADLAHEAALSETAEAGSIFFGGGTPSLMVPETAAAVIDAVRAHWRCADNIEITLEANPSSAEAARFKAFADAGVNRISLGAQSFDDRALKFLGRVHDARAAHAAIEAARKAAPRVSFDLIYALPGQSAADWRAELARARPHADAAGHISAYQLTIEPGTEFFRSRTPAADENSALALYDITQDAFSAWGLSAYEVSNHARAGAECRHNLNIWRGGAYAGVGPGAHGRLRAQGVWKARHRTPGPARWLESVRTRGHGLGKEAVLSPHERAEEITMTALRLSEGLDVRTLPAPVIDEAACARMAEGGFVKMQGSVIRATAAGRKRLNAVTAALLGGAPV
ncbi:MAG: radical SAM family heme chaperone HemW [Rhodospirillales bacterium]